MGCGPSSAIVPSVDKNRQLNQNKGKPGTNWTYQNGKADEGLDITRRYMGVFVGCLLIW